MESFDSNKVLPNSAIIVSAETHSYRIGLSFKTVNYVKRSILYNYLFIFCVYNNRNSETYYSNAIN